MAELRCNDQYKTASRMSEFFTVFLRKIFNLS
jgi:hypothetical protein